MQRVLAIWVGCLAFAGHFKEPLGELWWGVFAGFVGDAWAVVRVSRDVVAAAADHVGRVPELQGDDGQVFRFDAADVEVGVLFGFVAEPPLGNLDDESTVAVTLRLSGQRFLWCQGGAREKTRRRRMFKNAAIFPNGLDSPYGQDLLLNRLFAEGREPSPMPAWRMGHDRLTARPLQGIPVLVPDIAVEGLVDRIPAGKENGRPHVLTPCILSLRSFMKSTDVRRSQSAFSLTYLTAANDSPRRISFLAWLQCPRRNRGVLTVLSAPWGAARARTGRTGFP